MYNACKEIRVTPYFFQLTFCFHPFECTPFVSTFTFPFLQTFCQSHCASLAQFSSLSELETIVKEIRSSSLHQLGRRFFLDTISASKLNLTL